jgi:hypothetical protein
MACPLQHPCGAPGPDLPNSQPTAQPTPPNPPPSHRLPGRAPLKNGRVEAPRAAPLLQAPGRHRHRGQLVPAVRRRGRAGRGQRRARAAGGAARAGGCQGLWRRQPEPGVVHDRACGGGAKGAGGPGVLAEGGGEGRFYWIPAAPAAAVPKVRAGRVFWPRGGECEGGFYWIPAAPQGGAGGRDRDRPRPDCGPAAPPLLPPVRRRWRARGCRRRTSTFGRLTRLGRARTRI